jgi:hypothetical protein
MNAVTTPMSIEQFAADSTFLADGLAALNTAARESQKRTAAPLWVWGKKVLIMASPSGDFQILASGRKSQPLSEWGARQYLLVLAGYPLTW